MSEILVAFVILVPGTCAFVAADGKDGFRLCLLIVLAGIFFLIVLWQFDETIPFAGVGDDKDYYTVSKRSFNKMSDWFNLRQFKQTHEQAGYPLLLSWINQFAGGSLYHRKAVNIFFFLMLALVWFAIGKRIGGRRLAFVSATGVLLATPLWFYWMFLLKDMVVTFLQSLFILGLIQSRSARSVARGYGLIALSTVLTIPFRIKLVLVNLVSLAGATILRTSSRLSWGKYLFRVILTTGLILSMLIIGLNNETLQQLGAAGEHRSLDVGSLQAEAETRGGAR